MWVVGCCWWCGDDAGGQGSFLTLPLASCGGRPRQGFATPAQCQKQASKTSASVLKIYTGSGMCLVGVESLTKITVSGAGTTLSVAPAPLVAIMPSRGNQRPPHRTTASATAAAHQKKSHTHH